MRLDSLDDLGDGLLVSLNADRLLLDVLLLLIILPSRSRLAPLLKRPRDKDVDRLGRTDAGDELRHLGALGSAEEGPEDLGDLELDLDLGDALVDDGEDLLASGFDGGRVSLDGDGDEGAVGELVGGGFGLGVGVGVAGRDLDVGAGRVGDLLEGTSCGG